MRTRVFIAISVVGLLAALTLGIQPRAGAQGGGTIVGEVKYMGAPPAPETIKVTKDMQVCGQDKKSPELVVGSGNGIEWAVVSVADAKGSPPKPAKKPALDQKGCEFHPHVLLVPAGAEIDILNSDGILHNIHTHSTANSPFNKSQPKFKKVIEAKFDKPEIIKVKCDVHGWMGSWIVVMGHPWYAVTDGKGGFKIENVPAGKHKLEVWHETLGKVTKEVEVKPGAEVKVAFELAKK